MKNNQQANGARPANADGKKATDETGAGSLDKVRDILFGAQVRDADRRFARIEERIAKETADLKDDVRKRLSVLEQYVKREFEALADRLKTEHEARADAVKELSRELRDTAKANEKKLGQIDDQIARVQRDLRQQLLDAQQQIRDEMQQQSQDHLARLTRDSAALRDDKLDRNAFAAMLTEMALRLTDESKPGADGE